MKVDKGLYYSKDHEWVRIDGNQAFVGITDFAQESMGDIVFVELPEIDDSFEAEDSFAVVESVKAAADIYLPIAGTVVDVNQRLEDQPELLNTEAFEQHIAVLEDFDAESLQELMDADAYEAYCNSLE